MTYATDTADVYCPYCGERIEIVIDLSIDHQEYVEDCSVCCQPIFISTNCDTEGNLFGVNATREND